MPEDMDDLHENGDQRIDKFQLGAKEAIYGPGPNGRLITDRARAGTLNYGPSRAPRRARRNFMANYVAHGILDVLPYLTWGNGTVLAPICDC